MMKPNASRGKEHGGGSIILTASGTFARMIEFSAEMNLRNSRGPAIGCRCSRLYVSSSCYLCYVLTYLQTARAKLRAYRASSLACENMC